MEQTSRSHNLAFLGKMSRGMLKPANADGITLLHKRNLELQNNSG
jgi:hypothetical protein